LFVAVLIFGYYYHRKQDGRYVIVRSVIL